MLRMLCLLSAILLLPLPAEASNVQDDLVVGILSSKTTAIRPLEPIERDFMSIYDLMYDGLMDINDDYKPELALAESYSHNGKTWTFKLREGLKFSDGSPVTATDVAATTEWILRKANAEAAAIMDKASADIAMEKKKALNDAKDEISDLAMAIAGKVVGRELSDADQSKLIDSFIDELGDQV